MPVFYHRDDGPTHTIISFRPPWYVCRFGGLALMLASVFAWDTQG